MSRAGLISFILLSILTGLATSAPLATRLSSLDEHHQNHDNDVVARDLVTIDGREYYIVDPEYTTREYDTSLFDERDIDELEERGFFSSLKNDLGKVAHVALKADTIGLKVASKGLKFVPGVGKGFATAAGLASKGTNALANDIHRRGFFSSLKNDLGKVAHVALKADTIGLKVASKGLKFVPGVGKGFATAAGIASKGTNALANKIQRRDELEYTERDDFNGEDLQERGFFSSLKHDLGDVAHVALKADTIGLKVASKGLKFVPGVGKGFATAAGLASKGTNALANAV